LPSLTTDGTVLGTYEYMSPEQSHESHAADPRSDVYALGCTFYHCLTGHPPFVDKSPVRLVMRHATEAPAAVTAAVTDAPHAVAEAVATMLAKSPDERFQSMADVAHALDPYADEPSAVAEKEEGFEQFMVSLRGSAGGSPGRPPQSAGFLRWLADGLGTGR